jgi:hypothetical protein
LYFSSKFEGYAKFYIISQLDQKNIFFKCLNWKRNGRKKIFIDNLEIFSEYFKKPLDYELSENIYRKTFCTGSIKANLPQFCIFAARIFPLTDKIINYLFSHSPPSINCSLRFLLCNLTSIYFFMVSVYTFFQVNYPPQRSVTSKYCVFT